MVVDQREELTQLFTAEARKPSFELLGIEASDRRGVAHLVTVHIHEDGREALGTGYLRLCSCSTVVRPCPRCRGLRASDYQRAALVRDDDAHGIGTARQRPSHAAVPEEPAALNATKRFGDYGVQPLQRRPAACRGSGTVGDDEDDERRSPQGRSRLVLGDDR